MSRNSPHIKSRRKEIADESSWVTQINIDRLACILHRTKLHRWTNSVRSSYTLHMNYNQISAKRFVFSFSINACGREDVTPPASTKKPQCHKFHILLTHGWWTVENMVIKCVRTHAHRTNAVFLSRNFKWKTNAGIFDMLLLLLK